MKNIAHLLKSCGFAPRKRFSQNFLIDEQIADRITAAIKPSEGDTVIEIGPGLGALTERLLDTGAQIIAVEIDRGFAGLLEKRFGSMTNLKIMNADALKISYRGIAGQTRVKLISNLPYNISTPVIFKILDEKDIFSLIVLMLQKEVAQRIVARPGSKDYGVLSIFVQLFADVKMEFDVPPSSFHPAPAVYSSVISLSILGEPRVHIGDTALFKQVVRAAFGQRRKTLSNALKSLHLPAQGVRDSFEKTGIDPGRRGETLSIEEFGALSNCLAGIGRRA